MWIYRCLTFKEMFQGARSTDAQNRGLLIQLLLKPTNPFFKISLRNVGNLRGGGGGGEKGGGGGGGGGGGEKKKHIKKKEKYGITF